MLIQSSSSCINSRNVKRICRWSRVELSHSRKLIWSQLQEVHTHDDGCCVDVNRYNSESTAAQRLWIQSWRSTWTSTEGFKTSARRKEYEAVSVCDLISTHPEVNMQPPYMESELNNCSWLAAGQFPCCCWVMLSACEGLRTETHNFLCSNGPDLQEEITMCCLWNVFLWLDLISSCFPTGSLHSEQQKFCDWTETTHRIMNQFNRRNYRKFSFVNLVDTFNTAWWNTARDKTRCYYCEHMSPMNNSVEHLSLRSQGGLQLLSCSNNADVQHSSHSRWIISYYISDLRSVWQTQRFLLNLISSVLSVCFSAQ